MSDKIELLELNTSLNKEIDCKSIFDKSFVNLKESIPRQPVAISIGEYVYKNTLFPAPFGTYGNYSCIVAPSKSKKSFFKSALLAGYIGGNAIEYFPNIRGHRNENSVVIDIDTEQSKYDAQKVFRRTMEMVGNNYPYYFPFYLRSYSPMERMQFIDWIFNEWENRKHISLVSIDGYADLINNFNDIEQSNDLTARLMKWTDTSKCHITGILHSNFGNDKPVGHIGSSILKKAETVVYLTKEEGIDRDYTKVDADKYSRNKSFEPFRFFINDNWLPQSEEIENKIAF